MTDTEPQDGQEDIEPEPTPEPAEEPSESLANDGTPGAAPLEDDPPGGREGRR
jgi:hypothetical protein